MRVLLTGTTGMVGQGVLRECLLAPDVSEVVSLGRSPLNDDHPKLRSIVVTDLFDLDGAADALADIDACFFCLGVSSVGMSADTYERLTHDLTIGVADALTAQSPDPTFVYVSGAGTSETSRQRWAQVKGRTERELLERFPKGYMFRPGLHRAAARHPAAQPGLPDPADRGRLPDPALPPHRAQPGGHHRRGRQGDARGGPFRRAQTHPRQP